MFFPFITYTVINKQQKEGIRSHNLSRFYFPYPNDPNLKIPQFVSDLEEITDHDMIFPGYNFSISKSFNFPSNVRHKCNYYTLICLIEGTAHLKLDTDFISFIRYKHIFTGIQYLQFTVF